MKISLVILDGVFDTGLAAIQDTFALAHDLARASDPGLDVAFSISRVGVEPSPRTASGLMIPTDAADTAAPPDIAIVPAIGAKTPADLERALASRDVAEAGALLCKWRDAGTTVAAACTGTFVLAEAGLLDGTPSTTSWWLAEYFRSRYPRVRLDTSRMVLSTGGVVTAGAALAHFDLALSLIRRESRALASSAARYLSIEDLRSSHAAFAIPDHVANHRPVVERFESWAQNNLAAGFSLAEAAKAVGASPRTLTRKMRSAVGKSPLEVFQDMRVARAIFLLRMTETSVEEIAREVGYADSVSLRMLVRRKLGCRISDLRSETATPGKRSAPRRQPARVD